MDKPASLACDRKHDAHNGKVGHWRVRGVEVDVGALQVSKKVALDFEQKLGRKHFFALGRVDLVPRFSFAQGLELFADVRLPDVPIW
jgi:hypothetical protein